MVTTASLRSFPRSNTFASIAPLIHAWMVLLACRGQRGSRRGNATGGKVGTGSAGAGARFAGPPERDEVPVRRRERVGGTRAVIGGEEGRRDGGGGPAGGIVRSRGARRRGVARVADRLRRSGLADGLRLVRPGGLPRRRGGGAGRGPRPVVRPIRCGRQGDALVRGRDGFPLWRRGFRLAGLP